jgi:hypothetical protein
MTYRAPFSDLPRTRPIPVTVPAGAPAWVTAELLEHTLRVWQPKYNVPLTPDDALAIILNVGRLFEVLSRGTEP